MTEELEALERDYHQSRAKIWGDDSLSWEKKSLRVRQLGLAYDRARKEAAEQALAPDSHENERRTA
jgi:hypothetical protein